MSDMWDREEIAGFGATWCSLLSLRTIGRPRYRRCVIIGRERASDVPEAEVVRCRRNAGGRGSSTPQPWRRRIAGRWPHIRNPFVFILILEVAVVWRIEKSSLDRRHSSLGVVSTYIDHMAFLEPTSERCISHVEVTK